MGFRDDIRAFTVEVGDLDKAIFVETAVLAHESIVEGSSITGAPGQPVDTGALKASWHLDFEESQANITTPLGYAPVIEDDLRSSFDRSGDEPVRPKSPGGGTRHHKSTVGGHQSVTLTLAGIDRLIDEAGRRVQGGA
jgi:hypothetical protein